MVAELEALDGQEECKQNSKAKQMSIGRKKFNMDPKKGKLRMLLHSIRRTIQFVRYHFVAQQVTASKFFSEKIQQLYEIKILWRMLVKISFHCYANLNFQ